MEAQIKSTLTEPLFAELTIDQEAYLTGGDGGCYYDPDRKKYYCYGNDDDDDGYGCGCGGDDD